VAHLGEAPSRAQLILFVGFTLAVVFVALAFLLNSVIFTENLATRSEAARTSNAIAVSDDVERGVVSVVDYANEHNTSSYSEVEGELEDGTGNIERLLGRQQLSNDAVVSVTFTSYNKATWVNQSYQERNFTDKSGRDAWVLVDSANDTREFRINVTNTSRLESTAVGSPRFFTVTATDGTSDEWTMEIYHNVTGTDEYEVEVVDGNGITRTCNVPGGRDTFWVNVSDGTMGGDECRALRFGENISAVEKVDFNNGDNIEGTYRLLVGKEEENVNSAPYNTTGSPPAPPILSSAAWNATVHVEYETGTLTFETEVHAAPGEEDE